MDKISITDGVQAFRQNKNAVLLDVRTKEEYNRNHIEGSVNIPIQSIEDVKVKVTKNTTPIYVYCHSGIRSAKAARALSGMGYLNITDIGGIINLESIKRS